MDVASSYRERIFEAEGNFLRPQYVVYTLVKCIAQFFNYSLLHRRNIENPSFCSATLYITNLDIS